MDEPKEFKDPRLITPELNERFLAHDNDNPLSDEELERVGNFYRQLEQMINLLGRDFFLVKKEVDRRLLKVRYQKDHRKQQQANAEFREKLDETLKKT